MFEPFLNLLAHSVEIVVNAFQMIHILPYTCAQYMQTFAVHQIKALDL